MKQAKGMTFLRTCNTHSPSVAVVHWFEYLTAVRKPIILLVLLLIGCLPNGVFDSERWKNADLSTLERVEMLDALFAQHPLKGMPRSNVVELLGEPTSTDKWEDWDMIYVLGPTEYMPIDHQWLVIDLDEAGQVSDYEVTAD